jgi:hypothetical protein
VQNGPLFIGAVGVSYRYAPLYLDPSVSALAGVGVGAYRPEALRSDSSGLPAERSLEPLAVLGLKFDWPLTAAAGVVVDALGQIALTDNRDRFRGTINVGVRYLIR